MIEAKQNKKMIKGDVQKKMVDCFPCTVYYTCNFVLNHFFFVKF